MKLIHRLAGKNRVFRNFYLFFIQVLYLIFVKILKRPEETFQEYEEHLELHQEWATDDILSFIEHRDGQLVLDIGCGPGILTVAVDGIGIDIEGFSQWEGDFVKGDARFLPFRDDSFDMAIMANLLEHVVDPQKVISEVKRVSRRVYVSFPSRCSISALYHFLDTDRTGFYGGLDYSMVMEAFKDFKKVKERDKVLPFTLRSNLSNPEIVFEKAPMV